MLRAAERALVCCRSRSGSWRRRLIPGASCCGCCSARAALGRGVPRRRTRARRLARGGDPVQACGACRCARRCSRCARGPGRSCRSPRTVRDRSRTVRRKSGSTIPSHRCRHTFASGWLAVGGSPPMLQELLGHQSCPPRCATALAVDRRPGVARGGLRGGSAARCARARPGRPDRSRGTRSRCCSKRAAFEAGFTRTLIECVSRP